MLRTTSSNCPCVPIGFARHAAAGLVACIAFGLLSSPAFAQARLSRLLPNRDSAPPGATVTLAVQPPLATQQPAGSRLLLRSTRRDGADLELRVVQWRGGILRAQIPRNAEESSGAARFVLLDRRDEVMADSGNRMFRVASRAVRDGDRVAGGDPVTGSPGRGWSAAPRQDARGGVAGRSNLAGISRAAVPPATPNPRPDPRGEQRVAAQVGGMYTPGVAGKVREVEVAAQTVSAGTQPQLLRDVSLPGMDYRHFAARSVAECFEACSVEGRCKSWTLRPAQRNNTFDNGDDGPVCWLKSGTPRREYARGYTSGIKPTPPAVGREVPPPPVVRR